jgi:hypothetical protein
MTSKKAPRVKAEPQFLPGCKPVVNQAIEDAASALAEAKEAYDKAKIVKDGAEAELIRIMKENKMTFYHANGIRVELNTTEHAKAVIGEEPKRDDPREGGADKDDEA